MFAAMKRRDGLRQKPPPSDKPVPDKPVPAKPVPAKPVPDKPVPAKSVPTKPVKGVRKKRILDAAEALFAHHGFDGVTMRQIASRADVDVALASYHFGNKQDLFEAVMFRRSLPMNDVRQKALDDCLAAAAPGAPTVEDLIDITLKPLFGSEERQDEGWRHYYELVAYVNNSAEWGEKLMEKLFGDLRANYLAAYKKALPDADEKDIFWCYHFMSGAIALTMAQTGRINHYSGGLCSAQDLHGAYERMVPFITAGFEKLCETPKA